MDNICSNDFLSSDTFEAIWFSSSASAGFAKRGEAYMYMHHICIYFFGNAEKSITPSLGESCLSMGESQSPCNKE